MLITYFSLAISCIASRSIFTFVLLRIKYKLYEMDTVKCIFCYYMLPRDLHCAMDTVSDIQCRIPGYFGNNSVPLSASMDIYMYDMDSMPRQSVCFYGQLERRSFAFLANEIVCIIHLIT